MGVSSRQTVDEHITAPFTGTPIMQTVSSLAGLRSVIGRWKRSGYTIALVPTMGNLHDGHISLLNHARECADRTVLSIFVNPIQFGKGEDYDKYPSTLADDKNKLEKYGLDLLFTPDLKQLYPGGTDIDTRINVPDYRTYCAASPDPTISPVLPPWSRNYSATFNRAWLFSAKRTTSKYWLSNGWFMIYVCLSISSVCPSCGNQTGWR